VASARTRNGVSRRVEVTRSARYVRPGRRHVVETAKYYAMTGADHCAYCGRFTSRDLPPTHELKATADHIIPRSLGGLDHRTNYIACCRRCNSSKGARTVRQWLKSALAPPWAVPGWVSNPQPEGIGTPSRDW